MATKKSSNTIKPFLKSTDTLRYCHYALKRFEIQYSDKKTYVVNPSFVNNIDIQYAFDAHLYPVFHVEVVLDPDNYYKIIEDKKKVKFFIKMHKFFSDSMMSPNSITQEKAFLSDTFDLILDDSEYDIYKKMRDEGATSFGANARSTQDDLNEINNVFDLYLYKSEYVDKFNKEISVAYLQKATVTDGICYIFHKIGLGKCVLMKKPDNTDEYDPLILPPMKAKDAIRWLDCYYGLYKRGMFFFVDYIRDVVYLIPYSGACSAKRAKEKDSIFIMIPNKTTEHLSEPCMIDRSKTEPDTIYIMGNPELFKIQNEATSLNEYGAMDLTVMSPDSDTINSSSTSSKSKAKNSVHTAFKTNYTQNPWIHNYYQTTVDSLTAVIEAQISNFDLSEITPNKRLRFRFEDAALGKKYENNFILTNMMVVFTKAGSSYVIDAQIRCQTAQAVK